MDKILENFVKIFESDFEFSNIDNSKLFEHFVNYSIISKFDEDRTTIEKINVGGTRNPGIDGLAIIVNDHIVTTKEEVDYFQDVLGRLDVEFLFIQAKTSTKFEMSQINNFMFSVKNFFSEKTTLNFEDELLNLVELKDYILSKSIDMESSPVLKLYYATAGTWIDDENLIALIEASKKELQETGLFSKTSFYPIDAEKLKSLYREIKHKITKEIVFEKHTILPNILNVKEAYIGFIPLKELLNLIINEDGDIIKNIFYDNVRDFQGFNHVNNKIKQTIENTNINDRFVLLNNGITIVARDINKVGTSFKIKDYQIVNGCQTSHVVYYSKDKIKDNIYIPLKLIVSDNNDVINNVIMGTNQQTEVKNEAFEILSDFHKKLEEFYLTFEKEPNKRLYYERRTKQYINDNRIKKSHIITLSTQITSFVSMFLNEPHSTLRYFGELLRAYNSRMFVDSHLPEPYYTSGLALNVVERLYQNKTLNPKFKRFKHHLIMLFRIKTVGEKIPKLSSKKNIVNYCQPMMEILWDIDKASKLFVEIEQKVIDTYNKTSLLKRQAHLLRAFTEELIPELKNKKKEGKITYFNKIKGFGFVRINNTEEDIFIHVTEIYNDLGTYIEVGDTIKFNVIDTYKGKQAKDIEK